MHPNNLDFSAGQPCTRITYVPPRGHVRARRRLDTTCNSGIVSSETADERRNICISSPVIWLRCSMSPSSLCHSIGGRFLGLVHHPFSFRSFLLPSNPFAFIFQPFAYPENDSRQRRRRLTPRHVNAPQIPIPPSIVDHGSRALAATDNGRVLKSLATGQQPSKRQNLSYVLCRIVCPVQCELCHHFDAP